MQQRTVKDFITFKGIGLHSGVEVNLMIKPAPVDMGIVFKRVDLEGKPEIPALYKFVVDTVNSTNLGFDGKMYVRTIEHLMAALYMAGVDNAMVEVDAEEMPIMDGSAKEFYEKIKIAGVEEHSVPRVVLKVKKEVSFSDDKGNAISIKPFEKGLKVDFEIDFPSPIIGHQVFSGEIEEKAFESKIIPARTFCEKWQVDYLQSIGLVKGGSLDNAIVIDGEKILNPEGLRHDKECINHKVLDLIGDMFTSGYHIYGAISASKTGHYHSNELLKKLFSDENNYELG